MPYPVSPPVPPVVHTVSTGESSGFHGSIAPLLPAEVQEEGDTTECAGESQPCSELLESASQRAEELGAPLWVGTSEMGTSDVLEERSTAESGLVLEHSTTLPPSAAVELSPASQFALPPRPPAPRFTTLWAAPGLEALTHTPNSNPYPSPTLSSATRAELVTELGETESTSPHGTADSPLLLDRAEDGAEGGAEINLQDSIRLDLPTPPSSPSAPGTSNRADQSLEETEAGTEAPSTQPVNPQGLPLPQSDPMGGEVLTIPTPARPRSEDGEAAADPTTEPPAAGDTPNSIPIDPQAVGEVLEVTSDRQEFDEQQRIFRADGNVTVRFRQGVLTADRVRVNLPNRVAVAEGNAVLTRGEQSLRGEQFTYNFGLNQGIIQTAGGVLFLPAASRDFNPAPPFEMGTLDLTQPITRRVSDVQPLQVTGGVPGITFGVGANAQQGGLINRLRFEADRAEFVGGDLVADNVRITNDPFSPPELELRSNRVTYTRLSPTQAEIRARNPRLVFDQGFSLPLLVNRLLLDSRERDSGLLSFGYDERDRDGFFVQRTFDVYSNPVVSFSLTPQLLVQRAISQGGFPVDPDHYGLVGNLDFRFTPTTTAQAVANFSSLDPGEVEDNLRASVRLRQLVYRHTVALDYSYRDRLFNGSLGFQNIQSSVGLVVSSPVYVLGDSLINLNYQGSVQYVRAETDRRDLLPLSSVEELEDILNVPPGTFPPDLPASSLPLDADRAKDCIDPDDRDITGNGCANLMRYQAAINLTRFFPLWVGTALPPTREAGLRYSPTLIFPYVGISLEGRGVISAYSNGESQSSLRGGISLLGQFGHFSKPVFDYTAFSVGYFNTLRDGESPFLFDRIGDEQFVVASLTQQIYGPLRFGIQAVYNLDTQDEIDTVFQLEYSRRTYSILATYSTGRSSAALTLRLNDFNWTGDPGPFSGLGSSTVESGVIQEFQ